MPVVSAWIMPAGIAGVLAMPFGFDGFFWWLMGMGIDWMIKVVLWVADLPGFMQRRGPSAGPAPAPRQPAPPQRPSETPLPEFLRSLRDH